MPQQKSDFNRAFSEDGAIKTHVGGQALLEGIMMRGKLNWSCAVRRPDGNIYLEEHDLASGKDKNSWTRKPLIRGCTALVESLGLGFKALEVAASHAFDEEDCSYSVYLEEAEKALAAGNQPEGMAAQVLKVQRGEIAAQYIYGDGEGEQDERGQVQQNGQGDMPSDAAMSEVSTGSMAVPSLDGDINQSCDVAAAGDAAESVDCVDDANGDFDWVRDFGNPDTMIDALGAQRTLQVVCEPDASGLDVHSSENLRSGEGGLGKAEMTISMILGVALAIVLFIVAPAFITNLVMGEYDANPFGWNIFDGVLRVAVFVFYMWLIGRMKDIKRMFGYHGAEHKAIHCFEHGLPMTPENARKFPRLHVRCGTAFLIMVLVIAILVYTIIPVNLFITQMGVPDGLPKLLLVIVTRIVFLPIIAGISYEITVKWAGSRPDHPLVKIILWPGMQMQYLTTNEPDDGQIECAIAAMSLVLQREEADGLNSRPGSCCEG